MLAMKEAINLICNFYGILGGFWEHEVSQYPEAVRFIDEGYAELSTEYKELYVLNDDGYAKLHEYIKEISIEFIAFMRSHQYECQFEFIIQWFIEKYKLDDSILAEEISNYIIKNLHNYGYEYKYLGDARKVKRCLIIKI